MFGQRFCCLAHSPSFPAVTGLAGPRDDGGDVQLELLHGPLCAAASLAASLVRHRAAALQRAMPLVAMASRGMLGALLGFCTDAKAAALFRCASELARLVFVTAPLCSRIAAPTSVMRCGLVRMQGLRSCLGSREASYKQVLPGDALGLHLGRDAGACHDRRTEQGGRLPVLFSVANFPSLNLRIGLPRPRGSQPWRRQRSGVVPSHSLAAWGPPSCSTSTLPSAAMAGRRLRL